MLILIQKDTPKLGRKGEIKDVPEGHARNFLIPKGLARPANQADVLNLKNQAKNKEEAKVKFQEKMAEIIKKVTDFEVIEVVSRTNEKGHLFSQFKKSDLIKILKDKGLEVPPEIIKDFSFKEVGEYKIRLEFEKLSRELRLVIKGE